MDKCCSKTPDFNEMVCSGKEYAKETPAFNHIVKERAELRHHDADTMPAKAHPETK